MKFLLVALLLLFTVSAYAADESHVLDLTPDNFDTYVDGSTFILVEFFAPWCGHCKRLEPEYEQVAAAFANTPSVKIAKVDADAHGDLGSRFGVKGFPTLFWFAKGDDVTEPEKYEGPRDAAGIIDWINGKAGTSAFLRKPPSAVTVLDATSFEEVVGKGAFALVEFYAPWCGHCKQLAPVYEELAQAFAREDKVVIANVDANEAANKPLAGTYGVTGFPTLKWFGPDSTEDPTDYTGARDIQALVDFVNEQAGTHRAYNGRYLETAGRVAELDDLAAKVVAGEDGAVAALEAAVANHPGSEFYAKAAKVFAKRGAEWPSKEVARVKRITRSGSVAGDKLDEFDLRVNILKAFGA